LYTPSLPPPSLGARLKNDREKNHRDRDSEIINNSSGSLKCMTDSLFGRAENPSPKVEIDFQKAVHHVSIHSLFEKGVELNLTSLDEKFFRYMFTYHTDLPDF
jgi:hypothetical protein